MDDENGQGDRAKRDGGSPVESVVPPDGAVLPLGLRRARVLEIVRDRQFASVADLSAAFGVSEVTIRSDLDVLAEEGRLRRVRGGAVHHVTSGLETSFDLAIGTQVPARLAIATAAAALVASGQTILLDSGTTAAATARVLASREDLQDVTVFTNGVPVAMELEPAIPRVTVMLTGGMLRRLQHSLVNPFGTTILDQVHGHVGVLECHGVDPSAGVTHSNVAEAEIKRLMMRAARLRVLVADGSKLGQVGLVHLYPISEIDLLITDTTADPAVIDAVRDQGVEVRVVG